MDLRYYQAEALNGSARYPGIWRAWSESNRTLIVMPTGSGKTIVFSALTAGVVEQGGRMLILAHRDELIRQAADKLERTTGLACAIEKADESAAGALERVVVASVQTLLKPERRAALAPPTHIVVDEAHHALAASYQAVLGHWPEAKVIGVTATPDRGDLRNLGQYFESLAYEYALPQAVHDGFLCRIKSLTIPLKLDLSGVKVNGDFQAEGLGTMLEPYLPRIAAEMAAHCKGRKTLVFAPLIATSQRLVQHLNAAGLRAREVNGDSPDRAHALEEFRAGAWDVLCNAMLLTEGYDEPSIDCVVVLRATGVRSLYAQMCGRGTRIHPGKDHLLLLDFLWMCERHQLCRPAHLVAEDPDVAAKMTEMAEREPGGPTDLDESAVERATSDVLKEREAALAKKLAAMRNRKRQLVDPIQFAASIGAADLLDYRPALPSEAAPATHAQIEALSKLGLFPGDVASFGHAAALLARAADRKAAGSASPRQIRLLERYGLKHVGTWSFKTAQDHVLRIKANGWRLPDDLRQ